MPMQKTRYRTDHRGFTNSGDAANQQDFEALIPQNDVQVLLSHETPSAANSFGGHLLKQFSCYNGSAADAHVRVGAAFPNSIWVAGAYDVSVASASRYVDDTTDAQSGVSNSFSVGGNNELDGYMIGSTRPFNCIMFDTTTAATAGTTWTHTYWNGSTFASLTSLSVHTNLLATTIEYAHHFTPPSDWTTTTGAAGEHGIDSASSGGTKSALTKLYVVRGIHSGPATAPKLARIRVGRMRLRLYDVNTVSPALSPHMPIWLAGNDETPWCCLADADTAGANWRVSLLSERSNFAGVLGSATPIVA